MVLFRKLDRMSKLNSKLPANSNEVFNTFLGLGRDETSSRFLEIFGKFRKLHLRKKIVAEKSNELKAHVDFPTKCTQRNFGANVGLNIHTKKFLRVWIKFRCVHPKYEWV